MGDSPLDLLNQALNVHRIESHGAAQVHGAQVAPLNKPLHGSWVDVEEGGSLLRREQADTGDEGRRRPALRPRVAPWTLRGFGRFDGACRCLSVGLRRSLARVALRRRIVDLEKGQLSSMNPHGESA
jgi:hypothetical protein